LWDENRQDVLPALFCVGRRDRRRPSGPPVPRRLRDLVGL
jgi:hypothetical protein